MGRVRPHISLVAVVSLAASAHAGVIYSAVDLDAPGPTGGELWQYAYTFQDYVPQQNVAVEILFDPLMYTDLQYPPPAVSGWNIVSLQPDPDFADPGRYSALALENNAPVTGPFTVTFAWLGQGSPGSQPVEINQFASDGSFVDTAATEETTAVPEPATALLIGSGLIAAGLFLRCRFRSAAFAASVQNRTCAGAESSDSHSDA
ncbi:MAG TPA: PEP-CTERM sorting domain-containing protein [Bryobacteraceae bacterium]|nr:PEP-CTERM sorting domain-containing protein [Bryobacteraceae bacterium]